MIGQKQKSAVDLATLRMAERPRLNPRAASFSAGTEIAEVEHDDTDASSSTDDIAGSDVVPSATVSPNGDGEGDSDEKTVLPVDAEEDSPTVYAPNLETLERLSIDDPDLAETLSEVSKEWPSPTTDDSGCYAKIWVSPLISEYERWQIVKQNLTSIELIPRSPFVPKTFSEWLLHRAEMTDFEAKELGKRLVNKEAEVELGRFRERVRAALGFKSFENERTFDDEPSAGRGAVLAQETIWSPWSRSTSTRPQADWPCQQEMKEEGDERNTSGFGRFPALPRIQANETVNYKHRNVIDATDLDSVWPLPPASPLLAEDEEAVASPDGDDPETLLHSDLLAALNE